MASNIFFSLNSLKPQCNNQGGVLTDATGKEVPGFVDISFSQLKLKPKGFQEPIWHPSGNKIGYCQQGTALVSIRTPMNVETFPIEEGDVFFVPEGYIHSIQNLDSKDNIIDFAFNSTNPQTMVLSKAINSLSDNVFNATFNSNSDFLAGLKKSKDQSLLKALPAMKNKSKPGPSKYKFNVSKSPKTIETRGGYLQNATKANLPILDGLGILKFGLNPKGDVEPHWHTNAGELVYIVRGRTKITVLNPQGNKEVLEVGAGEGAFAAASHFHNIENIGNDEVEVIAYFSNALPDYIGIGEVIGSYQIDMLASTFNVPESYFDALKRPQEPLVIVPV